MNDQLQTALADILTKTTDVVSAGVGFLQAELPDVVRQLLVWKMAEGAMYLLFAVMGLTAIVFAVRWAAPIIIGYSKGSSLYWRNTGNDVERQGKQLMEEYSGRYGYAVFASIVSCIAAIFVVISLPVNAGVMLQIWLAPKLYLIEYAARLVK